MNRREATAALLAGAFTARAADQPFSFTSLDHVEFFASNVEKSVAFYARIFGNTVLKNNRTTRRYLRLGGSYIAIENSGEAASESNTFAQGSKASRLPRFIAT